MKYSYKRVLFCWFTVVLIYSNCNMGAHYYTDPNYGKKKGLTSDNESKNHPQDAQEKSIYKRFEAAWARIEVPSEESIIQEIVSTIPACFTGKEKQWHSLAEEFVQNNKDFLIKEYKYHHQILNKIFLQLPSAHLEQFVLTLEASHDKGKLIEVFLQKAPPSGIEALISSEYRLGERLWLCFMNWIKKLGHIERLPHAMKKEMQKVIEEESLAPSACTIEALVGRAQSSLLYFAQWMKKTISMVMPKTAVQETMRKKI